MSGFTKLNLSRRAQLGVGAALLLALGATGGAGAVSMTRPALEMAPTVPTAVAKLGGANGIVTIKGRVAEVFGDRFVVDDGTGRTMVDAGREAQGSIRNGTAIAVQGRYDDGQLHASYLIDARGKVTPVGPGRPHHGPGREGPGREGPRPGGPGMDGRGAPPACAPDKAIAPQPVDGAVPAPRPAAR